MCRADAKAAAARRDAATGSSDTIITRLQSEVEALKGQRELLHESIRVQKELLQVKRSEKEEVEYQWGEDKARLAASEGDKIAMQVEMQTADRVIRKLKDVLLKNKRVLAAARLDPIEQRMFDEVEL